MLCLLSLIGFIYCFVSDIGYFFLFVDDLSVESEKSSFLNLVIDNLGENGFEFNEYLASQLRSLYALRIVFDILAMVGVALMYLKIKLGWTFYWIFQVAYVLAPYIFLNSHHCPSLLGAHPDTALVRTAVSESLSLSDAVMTITAESVPDSKR